jgi:glycosyltransferase involved in cell wall biosynthesis
MSTLGGRGLVRVADVEHVMGATRRVSVEFVNYHYWPDVAATGQHLTDLAEYLSSRGLEVRVLCGEQPDCDAAARHQARVELHGVRIRRLRTAAFDRTFGRNQGGRVRSYLAFHIRALATMLFGKKPHMWISLTTPSLLSWTVAVAAAIRSVPYGIWAMDLHPEVERGLECVAAGGALDRLLEAAARWAYARARFVVALGGAMAEHICNKGVDCSRVRQIPVWALEAGVGYSSTRENPLEARLGLTGKFVVLYAGNAGLAHRFDELVDAMERLKCHKDIVFVFIGGGPRRAEIERARQRRGLGNVRCLDYVPRSLLPCALALGDVHFVSLRTEMAGLVAPSKLQAALAAGRPVLMLGPPDSDPAIVIEREGVGHVVPLGSSAADELVRLILRYRKDVALRRRVAERARRVFEKKYSREVCCSAWYRVLEEALSH